MHADVFLLWAYTDGKVMQIYMKLMQQFFITKSFFNMHAHVLAITGPENITLIKLIISNITIIIL